VTLKLTFSLVVVFTVLGGISQVGVSLNNPVMVISISEIYDQNKKVKASN